VIRLILNVLWLIFGGGLVQLKLVPAALWPLGREVVDDA
jgi:uncharacterized membrane protein YccF (DUF307 family)